MAPFSDEYLFVEIANKVRSMFLDSLTHTHIFHCTYLPYFNMHHTHVHIAMKYEILKAMYVCVSVCDNYVFVEIANKIVTCVVCIHTHTHKLIVS